MEKITASKAREISAAKGGVAVAVDNILSNVEISANRGEYYVKVYDFGFTGTIGNFQKFIIQELSDLGYACEIITWEKESDHLEVRW